jgi:hypothetical protein
MPPRNAGSAPATPRVTTRGHAARAHKAECDAVTAARGATAVARTLAAPTPYEAKTPVPPGPSILRKSSFKYLPANTGAFTRMAGQTVSRRALVAQTAAKTTMRLPKTLEQKMLAARARACVQPRATRSA